MRWPQAAPPSRCWASRSRRPRCCNVCRRSRCARKHSSTKASRLSAEVRDFRLGVEISVIQAFADKIVRMLKVRDPLSERVHLSPIELLGQSLAGVSVEMMRRAVGRHGVSKNGGRRMTLEATADTSYGTHRVRQLVLRGDAHPAARPARGDVPDLQLLPQGRRHRRFRRAAGRTAGGAAAVARRHRRALSGQSAAALARLCRLGEEIRPAARGFSRHHRRHGNGRAAGHPRARHGDARSLLRSRRERRRAAVGEGVRTAARGRHPACASSRPRAATDQYPARHRRGCWSRPALSAARGPVARRHHQQRSGEGGRRPRAAEASACRWPSGRRCISPRPTRS